MHFRIAHQPNCPWCDRAMDLIRQKGDTYVAIDITKLHEDSRKAFKEQYKTVPQVFAGQDRIGGYEDLVKWYEAQTSA